MARAFLRSYNLFMQIQYELLKHRQSEYLKAIYETRGKQRIHGKSLLTYFCSTEPGYIQRF